MGTGGRESSSYLPCELTCCPEYPSRLSKPQGVPIGGHNTGQSNLSSTEFSLHSQAERKTKVGRGRLRACVRECVHVFMYVCLGRYVLTVVNRPHPLEDGDKSFSASVPSHLPTLDLPRGGRNLRPKHFRTVTLIFYWHISVKLGPPVQPCPP